MTGKWSGWSGRPSIYLGIESGTESSDLQGKAGSAPSLTMATTPINPHAYKTNEPDRNVAPSSNKAPQPGRQRACRVRGHRSPVGVCWLAAGSVVNSV